MEISTPIIPTTRYLLIRIVYSGDKVAQVIRMTPENWSKPRVGNSHVNISQGTKESSQSFAAVLVCDEVSF
jgi:hypothetical protein